MATEEKNRHLSPGEYQAAEAMGRDYGYSLKGIEAASKIIQDIRFSELASKLDEGTLADLDLFLKIQKDFAEARENRLMPSVTLPDITLPTLSRRRALQIGGVLGLAAIAGGAINMTYNNFLSPEAQAKRQEQAQKDEEKRFQEKIAYEKTHFLTNNFSAKSRCDWRIRYPELEIDSDYVEKPVRKSVQVVADESEIQLPPWGWFDIGRYTAVEVSEYTMSDKRKVPKLTVMIDEGKTTTQEWILRDQRDSNIDGNIDPRVVEFTHYNKEKGVVDDKLYVAFNRVVTEGYTKFEVKLMDRI